MNRTKIIKPRIGAHKSIAESIDLAIDRAVQSTCECLQIFTRPPRRWLAAKGGLAQDEIERFKTKSRKANYYDTAIHMPYLPNLASPNGELFERSVNVLIEEVKKASILDIPYVVTHLGSPIDRNEKFAANRVSDALNRIYSCISKPVMILLENSTALKKNWGTKIEHIEAIISKGNEEKYIGVCFDTAHAYSSGYDIASPEGLNETIDLVEQNLGEEKMRLIHINDSKGSIGSGIDHHEHIGKGTIGIECFRELMQNKRFKKIPMILETPKDNERSDLQNLTFLRELRREKN